MIRRVALVVSAALTLTACAKRINVPSVEHPPRVPLAHTIIPAPSDARFGPDAAFTVTGATRILVPRGDTRARQIGQFLSDLIGLAADLTPPAVDDSATEVASAVSGNIVLALDGPSSLGEEGYELTVTPARVTIAAHQPAGLFYGVQTFRHLLPAFVEHEAVRPDQSRPVTAPAATIVDRPRFAWRGAMLDVARHFLSTDEVKRYVDLLALHKMNRLHLHLADDQGWRFEIASWPKLATYGGRTQVGGGRGGYYTKAQYADLVAYAANRFITIVPEIDMPGHTNAALASYPELNCDGVARQLYTGIDVGFSAFCINSETTYRFIDDVVREIAAMTPGPYFHIGGDEVKTLAAADYVAFVNRVQQIVRSHGKQAIGWDEVSTADLVPTTIVQHWRPDASPAAAIAKGARLILSTANRTYLDMKYDAQTALGQNWAGYISVRQAYDWDPATLFSGVPEASIAGIEAPIWSETLANIRDVEHLAFPRLAAIAEVAWSPADRRRWDEFKARLGAQAARWSALGVNFYRAPEIEWAR